MAHPDGRTRRGTLTRARAAAVAAAALLLSCGGGGPTDSGGPPPSGGRDRATMLLGADVSALERIEQAGGVFRDAGQAGDALAILNAHGSSTFRLRLFVAPNDSEVQVNDLPYTLRMAARAKAAGAKLLLDIHYSDTWADPAHQTTPAAWASLGIDSLERRVESYTDSVVAALRQAGALPDVVQIGNEIDCGMLWPLGRVGGSYDTPAQWTQLARLLNAAIRGVHDALGPSDTVRIMLHYGQGANAAGTQWFFDNIAAYGVPYDLIGLSYYPFWHGSMAALRGNLQATALRYGKDIIVAETSYPWRSGYWEGMVTDPAGMTWAATPAGQASYLRALIDTVATIAGNHGAGVIWWYPEAIQVPGLFIWGGGSLALFDASGQVLPAASEFGAR